jgi:LmbE family N-acetylglucosaminyl deacetylase
MIQPENWKEQKTILVMLAHPDDPDFFCGATIARWARAGHKVVYRLFTRGDKGSNDPNIPPHKLAILREKEQRSAAEILGVESVEFLDYRDGELIPSLNARKDVVRTIRQIRPDILVTSDPTHYFVRDTYLNHPDHRIAGQIVLEGYFPAAGTPMFFPELAAEGLQPHSVKEIWISLAEKPNVKIDITDTWNLKLLALKEHKSQIGDPLAFEERMKTRRTAESSEGAPRYEELFHRLIFG